MAIDLRALEILAAVRMQAEINADGNTDAQAYDVKVLYDYWPKVPDGTYLGEGKIVSHSDDLLYKVKQGHPKLSTMPPDTSASLFTPIPKPGEDGTKENPISWVQGMESEEGKYYVEDDVLYLCIESSGTGLYGNLKDLARYFKKVEE